MQIKIVASGTVVTPFGPLPPGDPRVPSELPKSWKVVRAHEIVRDDNGVLWMTAGDYETLKGEI